MSETIADIVSEMRERFKPYARSDSNDARYTAYMGYAEFADRIEAAHEREIAAITAERDQWRKQALEEDARANAETQKPCRNCDKYTNFQDAWYAWMISTIHLSHSASCVWTDFIKWLFEPVEKGDNNGNK